MRDIIFEFTFNRAVGSRQLTLPVCFVLPDLAPIVSVAVFDKQSLIAAGYAFVEAPFVKRSIIIDNPSESVGQTILPLSFVICRKCEQIVQL